MDEAFCGQHDWEFEPGDFCPICRGIELEQDRILGLLNKYVWCELEEECLHVESCADFRGAIREIKGEVVEAVTESGVQKTYDAEEVALIKKYSRAYGIAEERERIIEDLIFERDTLIELGEDSIYVEGLSHAIILLSNGEKL